MRSAATELIAALRASPQPQLAFVRRVRRIRRTGAARRATATSPRTLGVLSASFNPLTLAHVQMLELAHAQFHFDEWLLVLALANVDKPISGFSLEDRMRLLDQWAATRPQVSLALCSHGRFVDKARAIRESYGDEPRVLFLLGYDTLKRLFDPKYYADASVELGKLFARAEVVAMNRGDVGLDKVRALVQRPEAAPFAPRIHVTELNAGAAGLSATAARDRLARGESLAGFVPPEIELAAATCWPL